MAELSASTSKTKTITIENFMTEDEKIARNRKKLNELEVLRSELNSVKRSGRPLFVSSYSDNPKGSVLFLSNNQARLRSQIEKEYQIMQKKVNKTESTSKDLDF